MRWVNVSGCGERGLSDVEDFEGLNRVVGSFTKVFYTR